MNINLGSLNEHALNLILKELVRRALETIRRKRHEFTVTEKLGLDGGADLFTTVDTATQALYARLISEVLPGVGIIAEEGSLRIPCRLKGVIAHITVDPVDGTKALVRNESSGIATQAALAIDGKVVLAWIGDVNTGELLGTRYGSNKVHRIFPDDSIVDMAKLNRNEPLSEQTVLLRAEPEALSSIVAKLARPTEYGGIFKGRLIGSGSLSLSVAQLWKGVVAAVVVSPRIVTPWDQLPVLCINDKLGIVALRPNESGEALEHHDLPFSLAPYKRDHEVLFVRRENADQLLAMF